jgi:hypothetical protein
MSKALCSPLTMDSAVLGLASPRLGNVEGTVLAFDYGFCRVRVSITSDGECRRHCARLWAGHRISPVLLRVCISPVLLRVCISPVLLRVCISPVLLRVCISPVLLRVCVSPVLLGVCISPVLLGFKPLLALKPDHTCDPIAYLSGLPSLDRLHRKFPSKFCSSFGDRSRSGSFKSSTGMNSNGVISFNIGLHRKSSLRTSHKALKDRKGSLRGSKPGTVRCAFFDRNLHSRMPLDPTHVRLKRTRV